MHSSHGRIPAIDGLRAVAVLSVLVYHLFPAVLPGGFVGVDIFFVISGYVVCGSLLKTPHQNLGSFLSGFYARRVLRIYPALIAMLTAVGILSRIFIPDSVLTGSCRNTGFAAFFGLSNFQLLWKSDGYFAPTVDYNPYLHTWSLAVEEQFYFLFPLVLFFCLRSMSFRSRLFAWVGFSILPLLFGISLLYCAWETFYGHDAAYFLLPSRFWEMALGAIFCLQHVRGRFLPHNAISAGMLTTCGLLGIAISLFLSNARLFPFPWALAPALGTASCLCGLAQPAHMHVASAVLSSRIATYLGRLSYSLYLWHWPLVVLLRWTIGLESVYSFAIALPATLLFACISYHFIEFPCQSLRSLHDRWTHFVLAEDRRSPVPGRVVFSFPMNLAIVIAGLGLVFAFSSAFAYTSRSVVLPLSVTMRSDGDSNLWKPRARKVSQQKLCAGDSGKLWSGKRLFVLGDSHASSYAEMLSDLRQREGVSVYLHWVGDIRIASLLHPQRDHDRAEEQEALQAIERYARPGDIAFLPSLRVLRIGSQFASVDIQKVVAERDSQQAELNRQIAVREGKDLIRKLEQMGLVVVIEAPKPVFAAPAFRCSDWFNRMNPIGRPGLVMHRDFLLQHRAAAMRSIAEVKQEFPNIRVWDPFYVLCTGETCSAFDGDKPVFFDNDHLSGYGNQKLYPDFVKHIDEIWGDTPSIAGKEKRLR